MKSKSRLSVLARRLAMHTELSAADCEAVFDLPHKVRNIDRGAYIVREGDRPESCAVLLDGYAFRHKIIGTGARQILALHLPGDPVDLQNVFLEVADHSLEALTKAEVR